MSWRDGLYKASFRGIEFYVRRAEQTGARKKVVHEFVGTEDSKIDDRGRKTPEFTIDAFVIGDDYAYTRDRLVAALDQAGEGDLIHPYRGRLAVHVKNWNIIESFDKGGMATFSITFIVSGTLSQATKITTAEQAATANQTLYATIKTAFQRVYDIASVPSTIAQNVLDTIDQGLDLISDAGSVVGQLKEFTAMIDSIKGRKEQLIYSVADLAEEITNVFLFVASAGGVVGDAQKTLKMKISAMKSVTEFYPVDQNTENPEWHLAGMFRQSAAAVISMLATEVNYEYYDAAAAMKTALIDIYEPLLEEIDDHDLYIAMLDMRSAACGFIDDAAINLPWLKKITIHDDTPSIVLAYRLYGSVDQEQSIIERNHISHPGFIPGHSEIEVLSNAD